MIFIIFSIILIILAILERKIFRERMNKTVKAKKELKIVYVLMYLTLFITAYFSAATTKGVIFLFIYLSLFLLKGIISKYIKDRNTYIIVDLVILVLIILFFFLSLKYILIDIGVLNLTCIILLSITNSKEFRRPMKDNIISLAIGILILLVIYIPNKDKLNDRIYSRQERVAKEYLKENLNIEADVYKDNFLGDTKGKNSPLTAYYEDKDSNQIIVYKLTYKNDEIIKCYELDN